MSHSLVVLDHHQKELGRDCVKSLSRLPNMTPLDASHIQSVWKEPE